MQSDSTVLERLEQVKETLLNKNEGIVSKESLVEEKQQPLFSRWDLQAMPCSCLDGPLMRV
jgi:hypothetical protein